jgi:hypothetical protein
MEKATFKLLRTIYDDLRIAFKKATESYTEAEEHITEKAKSLFHAYHGITANSVSTVIDENTVLVENDLSDKRLVLKLDGVLKWDGSVATLGLVREANETTKRALLLGQALWTDQEKFSQLEYHKDLVVLFYKDCI